MRILKSITGLNLIMGLWTLLLVLLLGIESFSPYFREIADNIMSKKDGVIYISCLIIYGFFIELLLRKTIQTKLQKKGRYLWLLTGLFYLPLHIKFGIIGVLYAIGSGIILSLWFNYKKSWLEMSLWHMLWGPLTIVFSLTACVLLDGPIRQDFLFSYKKRHLKKSLLYYREGWGWADKTHYRPDHFAEIENAFKRQDCKITIHEGWVTPLRIPVHFSATYKLTPTEDEKQRWAQVCGIMLDFMDINENVQGLSPWYHGNQLSAWQFDDVSSALLCSIDNLPESLTEGQPSDITDQERLLSMWNVTGRQEVKRRVGIEEAWLQAGPKRQHLRHLVDENKGLWQREKTELPAGIKL